MDVFFEVGIDRFELSKPRVRYILYLYLYFYFYLYLCIYMFVYLFIYLCMYIYNVYDDKTWVLKSPPLQMEHVFTANLHHWGM